MLQENFFSSTDICGKAAADLPQEVFKPVEILLTKEKDLSPKEQKALLLVLL